MEKGYSEFKFLRVLQTFKFLIEENCLDVIFAIFPFSFFIDKYI